MLAALGRLDLNGSLYILRRRSLSHLVCASLSIDVVEFSFKQSDTIKKPWHRAAAHGMAEVRGIHMENSRDPVDVGQLLAAPGLADALESQRFKQFLDHVPVAIAVAEVQPSESIAYCNLEFERLTGQAAAVIQVIAGKSCRVLQQRTATTRR